MNLPSYEIEGDVVTDSQTADAIVEQLRERGRCVIGWTDNAGSHHDVLFTTGPTQFGNLHGGLRTGSHIFVSVMRVGAFGFLRGSASEPGYYADKIGMGWWSENSPTCIALAELINMIRIRL